MILRPAGPADAAQVAEVDLAARRAGLPEVNRTQEPAEVRQWIAETLIPGGGVHVADLRGAVLGYLALRGPAVDQLCVRPGCWRRGIGTALIGLAKDHSPAGLTLYCFQSNLPARAFYERQGFTAVDLGFGGSNEEGEPAILYAWPGRLGRVAFRAAGAEATELVRAEVVHPR